MSQPAEALRRTQEELAALARPVDQLAAGLDQLRQQSQALAKWVGKLTQPVDHLNRRVSPLEDRVGQLRGRAAERRYRNRAAAYVGRWLSAVEVWDTKTLARTLDLAVREGRISRKSVPRLCGRRWLSAGNTATAIRSRLLWKLCRWWMPRTWRRRCCARACVNGHCKGQFGRWWLASPPLLACPRSAKGAAFGCF